MLTIWSIADYLTLRAHQQTQKMRVQDIRAVDEQCGRVHTGLNSSTPHPGQKERDRKDKFVNYIYYMLDLTKTFDKRNFYNRRFFGDKNLLMF